MFSRFVSISTLVFTLETSFNIGCGCIMFPSTSLSPDNEVAAKTSSIWYVLSTDSDEIAKVALKCGTNGIIDRPKYLSTDKSASDDSLLHFAEIIDFDILVFIQPTSPMIKSKYINDGIKMIESGEYDSVFSATKEHWIPRWNKNIEPIDWDINNRPMRQDKPELYIENGMFYMTKRENLLESKLRYSGRIGVVDIPLIDSFQVDTMDDLKLINKILKRGR